MGRYNINLPYLYMGPVLPCRRDREDEEPLREGGWEDSRDCGMGGNYRAEQFGQLDPSSYLCPSNAMQLVGPLPSMETGVVGPISRR